MKIIIFIFIFAFNLIANDCSICLGPLNDGTSISLPCLHTYCNSCLDDWIEVFHNATCPNCRFHVGNSQAYALYKKFLLNNTINNATKLYNEQLESVRESEAINRFFAFAGHDEKLQARKQDLKRWNTYICTTLRLTMRHIYKSFNYRENDKQKVTLAQFKFLKNHYLQLKETTFINCNDIRATLGQLLKDCSYKIYNKKILERGIEIFKHEAAFNKILLRQYKILST